MRLTAMPRVPEADPPTDPAQAAFAILKDAVAELTHAATAEEVRRISRVVALQLIDIGYETDPLSGPNPLTSAA